MSSPSNADPLRWFRRFVFAATASPAAAYAVYRAADALCAASRRAGLGFLLAVGLSLLGLVVAFALLVNALVQRRRRASALAVVAFSLLGSCVSTPWALRFALKADKEAVVIGDMRGLVSAESAYQSANGGYYDSPRCMAEPWTCIPGFPRRPFDEEWPYDPTESAATFRNGYDRRFVPGPPAPAHEVRLKGFSPTSITRFAYTAAPRRLGCDGRRGFCTDDDGSICATSDGSMPAVVDGHCDHTRCQLLR